MIERARDHSLHFERPVTSNYRLRYKLVFSKNVGSLPVIARSRRCTISSGIINPGINNSRDCANGKNTIAITIRSNQRYIVWNIREIIRNCETSDMIVAIFSKRTLYVLLLFHYFVIIYSKKKKKKMTFLWIPFPYRDCTREISHKYLIYRRAFFFFPKRYLSTYWKLK